MVDMSDRLYAAREALKDMSFQTYGNVIRALEADRALEASRRQSDLLAMSTNPSLIVERNQELRVGQPDFFDSSVIASVRAEAPAYTVALTQSQEYRDHLQFFAKHEPASHEAKEATWAMASSGARTDGKTEAATAQQTLSL